MMPMVAMKESEDSSRAPPSVSFVEHSSGREACDLLGKPSPSARHMTPIKLKKGFKLQEQWHSFIEETENNVDNLIKDSFAVLCEELENNNCSNDNSRYERLRSLSVSGADDALTRGPKRAGADSGSEVSGGAEHGHRAESNCNTCDRLKGKGYLLSPTPHDVAAGSWTGEMNRSLEDAIAFRGPGSDGRPPGDAMARPRYRSPPAGIQELENIYSLQKNFFAPQEKPFAVLEPSVPPTRNISEFNWEHFRNHVNLRKKSLLLLEDDARSEISIPPPPPNLQSQALFGDSLCHDISGKKKDWGRSPPLPPKRTDSRLTINRPNRLDLCGDQGSVYAQPKSVFQRGSLLSTGSSESGSSSLLSDSDNVRMSPTTPASERDFFAWSSHTISDCDSPTDDFRSVSQLGDPIDSSSECNSVATGSGVYVKMNPPFSNADVPPYMNFIYSAMENQGGKGIVENALSPYLPMKSILHQNISSFDSNSSIYAQPFGVKPSHPKRDTCGSSDYASIASQAIEKTKKKFSKEKQNQENFIDFKELMYEVERKRTFRVGLNLFNAKPEIGIEYLARHSFLELAPESVAKFLISNQGLSKDKIGEYLGNLQNAFCLKVLSRFVEELNFTGLRIDKALRKLLEYMRVPGEAQKIEKVMEEFGKRFNKCNQDFSARQKSPDSVVTLSFAIMLLNTDLHSPNLKPENKMSVQQFIHNLRGIDDGRDFDEKLLKGIYKRLKKQEFRGGVDHVSQVQALERCILGKRPPLAVHYRRLVCLCSFSYVSDIKTKKEEQRPRTIFLFNDLLVVTKYAGKSKSISTYNYKESFSLRGLQVVLFHTPVLKFGIQVSRKTDNAVLLTLNADSEHDRYKFVMDLQESIFEIDEMERAKKLFQRSPA